MIQKYLIVRDEKKDLLTIEEFAVLERVYGFGEFPSYRAEDFSLRCKEEYNSDAVEKAIPLGKSALISVLRTRNMYPVSHHAAAIADSIIDLYESRNEKSVELLFDDLASLNEGVPGV